MGTHIRVRTESPVGLGLAMGVAARRDRRAGLPFATTLEQSFSSFERLPVVEAEWSRLSVEAWGPTSAVKELQQTALNAIARWGRVWLSVPVRFPQSEHRQDDLVALSLSGDQWAVTFRIDSKSLPDPADRRQAFEVLRDLGWPIQVDANDTGFYLAGPSQYKTSLIGTGKRSADPVRIRIASQGGPSDEYLAWLRIATSQFGDVDHELEWSFQTAHGQSSQATFAELSDALSSSGLPSVRGRLSVDFHLQLLNELERIRVSLGEAERAVTDLVVVEIDGGYEAQIDLITTQDGYFFEAGLRGGWDEPQLRELEMLLGSRLENVS